MLPIPTRGNYSYFLKRNLGQESSRDFRLMIDQLPCGRFGIQILAGLRPCQACMGLCACSVASAVSVSFQPRGLSPARLLRLWDSPGENTGVGCHALLQGVVPTQGLNPRLLLCRWTLHLLSRVGSPTTSDTMDHSEQK